MKKLVAAMLFIVIFVFEASVPVQAEFTWRYVGGNPRSQTRLTQQQAANWFVSKQGQNDLARQGRNASECALVAAYVTQQGVSPVLLRPGNMASFDGGHTWQRVQIRNLTFGQAGTCVRDSITLAWKNCSQVTGYYPAGMARGWVPVVVDACGNMIEIYCPPQQAEVPPQMPAASAPPITVIVNNNAPPAPVMLAPAGQACQSFIQYPGGMFVNATFNQPITRINITAQGGNGGTAISSSNAVSTANSSSNSQAQSQTQNVVPINIVNVNGDGSAGAGSANGAGSQTQNQ